MKKVLILFLSVLTFYACTDAKVAKVDKDVIKTEVNTLLVSWHKAATDANFDGYFDKMDSTAVFIGTAAEEIWTKTEFKNFSKPYFDKGKAWSFETLERTIYVNDAADFVWFDELLTTWMGTCRGSGVLEKKDNTWKIKQYVLSVPIPNDDIQAVILAKKKNDSIFLKKYQQ
tara:strand:- start:1202 stop:1717 length:516 start_codon:yes stop_codon:yes gene_type:complete